MMNSNNNLSNKNPLDEINTPMKVIIEHYDEKITIERNHSDITISELMEMFRSAALAAGYTEQTVDQYFDN